MILHVPNFTYIQRNRFNNNFKYHILLFKPAQTGGSQQCRYAKCYVNRAAFEERLVFWPVTFFA